MTNDAYAELMARHPARFKGFVSLPMDAPDAALNELHQLGECQGDPNSETPPAGH
jgi:predicted TIM-barrel fold metal-dependent hydrolase